MNSIQHIEAYLLNSNMIKTALFLLYKYINTTYRTNKKLHFILMFYLLLH
jgi:hypothetical protein